MHCKAKQKKLHYLNAIRLSGIQGENRKEY